MGLDELAEKTTLKKPLRTVIQHWHSLITATKKLEDPCMFFAARMYVHSLVNPNQ